MGHRRPHEVDAQRYCNPPHARSVYVTAPSGQLARPAVVASSKPAAVGAPGENEQVPPFLGQLLGDHGRSFELTALWLGFLSHHASAG